MAAVGDGAQTGTRRSARGARDGAELRNERALISAELPATEHHAALRLPPAAFVATSETREGERDGGRGR